MPQSSDSTGQIYRPEIQALIDSAHAAEKAGLYAEARADYERALYRLSEPADASIAAALLRWTGSAHRAEGNGEAAVDCFEGSLAVAELTGDRLSVAHALNWLGIVNYEWGQLDRALDFYRRAQAIAEEAGAIRLLAMVDQNMGVIANIRGDHATALRNYQDSLKRYRELGEENYVGIGHVLNNIGMLHTDLGNWAEAEEMFRHAIAVAEKAGDVAAQVNVETNRTELYFLQGDYARARESCDAAFELASAAEQNLGLGEAYKWYGIIYRETGKYNLAEAHLKAAAEIAERYTSPLLAGEVQRELAQVYRALDRNREALLALSYAHRVFNDLRAQLDLADVGKRLASLEELYLQVVRKWGESIESKDRYTAGHCQRVADYACMLAEEMGFDEQTIKWFRMGAFLHDVGKTVVPEDVLNKPGKFTPDEWELMRQHTVVGAEIVSEIDFPWDIRPMVRNHHERWDGSGYPDRLAGRAIPLSARILCVADVFDALTTNRSYRAAYSADEALSIMQDDSGRIFDPELFDIFKHLVQERLQREPVAAG